MPTARVTRAATAPPASRDAAVAAVAPVPDPFPSDLVALDPLVMPKTEYRSTAVVAEKPALVPGPSPRPRAPAPAPEFSTWTAVSATSPSSLAHLASCLGEESGGESNALNAATCEDTWCDAVNGAGLEGCCCRRCCCCSSEETWGLVSGCDTLASMAPRTERRVATVLGVTPPALSLPIPLFAPAVVLAVLVASPGGRGSTRVAVANASLHSRSGRAIASAGLCVHSSHSCSSSLAPAREPPPVSRIPSSASIIPTSTSLSMSRTSANISTRNSTELFSR
mmetsp:Transcript_44126/g.70855  ORF Transcript_44126/g.70855 Transcript_44126/m.70855 type:complete len:281 (+) Transcript_44126:304-1146(+)